MRWLLILFCIVAISFLWIIIDEQNTDIKHLNKEVKELQNQYHNLYNSHNYMLKQIEDMKQF